MRTEDGWLGYAHSRYSKGDYYVSVRLTKKDRELLDEYIETHATGYGVHLPPITLHSLAFEALRKWKYDSSTSTKTKEEQT